MILPLIQYQSNGLDVARQEYELATVYYNAACSWLHITDPHSVERFHDAVERRNEARGRYLAEMEG